MLNWFINLILNPIPNLIINCIPNNRKTSWPVSNIIWDTVDGQVFNQLETPRPRLTETQKLALRQMVGFRCQDCKKHEDEVGKLQPHRIIRGADGGLYIPGNIKMLCDECHGNYDY